MSGLRASSATMLVVASMIGTGIFTTSGFLLGDLGSKPAVITAWVVGGLLAMCGALAYAELGAALPKNGGEYQLLTRIYHPAVGFLAGITTVIVGFAAPIAACAIAFGNYLAAAFPGIPPRRAAIALVLVTSLVHSAKESTGFRWQDFATYGKIVLIVVFLVAGSTGPLVHFDEPPRAPLFETMISSPFAISLFWVGFAYSGWNAASYLAGEVVDPARTLPRATMWGTIVVTFLYLALNVIYLAGAPAAKLAGQLEVGQIAASELLGPIAGRGFALMIAIGLVATTGAYVMTGPRIAEAMGSDFPRLAWISKRSPETGPRRAITLQALVALAMVLNADYSALITAVGFVLQLWAGLTVLGVIVLRVREPNLPRPYKAHGYPVTPVAFVALTAWMIVRPIVEKPEVLLKAALALGVGLALYAWISRPVPAE